MNELSRYKWTGFLREDGRIGIRNKILVLYTVECAAFVAKKIAAAFPDDADISGFSGCTDNEYAVRMMAALTAHPNIGGVLAVGLGCEYTRPSKLAETARRYGKPAEHFFIQENGGTESSVQKGIQIVESMLSEIRGNAKKVPMGFSDLIIGGECGGSDFTSGLSGNVAVGNFFDLHIDNGGTAVFEEIVEAVALRELLYSRGKTERAKKELLITYDKAISYCKSVDQYSISSGNFVGGISTIEEKSMGAFVKSGSRPIDGVLKVAGRPPNPGLWLLDSVPDPYYMGFGYTNPNDNEGLMDLVSVGCQLLLFVTGRGSVVGSAVSPVIKITGNRNTYENMTGDMDFDASPLLDGTEDSAAMNSRLAGLIAAVCSGEKTKSEALGHKEYCIPYKYQSREVIPACKTGRQ